MAATESEAQKQIAVLSVLKKWEATRKANKIGVSTPEELQSTAKIQEMLKSFTALRVAKGEKPMLPAKTKESEALSEARKQIAEVWEATRKAKKAGVLKPEELSQSTAKIQGILKSVENPSERIAQTLEKIPAEMKKLETFEKMRSLKAARRNIHRPIKHLPVSQPVVPRGYRFIATGLGASMWFFLMYRAKEDGPALLGWKHPWDH